MYRRSMTGNVRYRFNQRQFTPKKWLPTNFPEFAFKKCQLEVRPQAPGLNRFDHLRRGGGQRAVSVISTLSVRSDIWRSIVEHCSLIAEWDDRDSQIGLLRIPIHARQFLRDRTAFLFQQEFALAQRLKAG